MAIMYRLEQYIKAQVVEKKREEDEKIKKEEKA